MYTVFTVRGFVFILARPPPPSTKNTLGSPFVTPVTAGFPQLSAYINVRAG
jgi:hypothetical protein